MVEKNISQEKRLFHLRNKLKGIDEQETEKESVGF